MRALTTPKQLTNSITIRIVWRFQSTDSFTLVTGVRILWGRHFWGTRDKASVILNAWSWPKVATELQYPEGPLMPQPNLWNARCYQ